MSWNHCRWCRTNGWRNRSVSINHGRCDGAARWHHFQRRWNAAFRIYVTDTERPLFAAAHPSVTRAFAVNQSNSCPDARSPRDRQFPVHKVGWVYFSKWGAPERRIEPTAAALPLFNCSRHNKQTASRRDFLQMDGRQRIMLPGSVSCAFEEILSPADSHSKSNEWKFLDGRLKNSSCEGHRETRRRRPTKSIETTTTTTTTVCN